jgi:hypothetical protein
MPFQTKLLKLLNSASESKYQKTIRGLKYLLMKFWGNAYMIKGLDMVLIIEDSVVWSVIVDVG